MVSVESSSFTKLWREAGGSSVVMIENDQGRKTMTLIQSVQRDSRRDTFIHVDFHEIQSDEAITAMIPVVTDGEPVGVKNEGGLLEVVTHEVEVECLPHKLPHEITINVAEMRAGDVYHLENLPAMEGVRFLGEPDMPLVAIVAPSAAEPKEVEAEAEEAEEGQAMDSSAGEAADSSDEKE